MQQQGSLDENGGNCTEHSDCNFFDCQGECDKIGGKCRSSVANNNLQVYKLSLYLFLLQDNIITTKFVSLESNVFF